LLGTSSSVYSTPPCGRHPTTSEAQPPPPTPSSASGLGCELGHDTADRGSGEPTAAGKAAAPMPASTGIAAAGAGVNRRPRPAGGGRRAAVPWSP
jgi:hypothetical protein